MPIYVKKKNFVGIGFQYQLKFLNLKISIVEEIVFEI